VLPVAIGGGVLLAGAAVATVLLLSSTPKSNVNISVMRF
jgi:hypothetical protein